MQPAPCPSATGPREALTCHCQSEFALWAPIGGLPALSTPAPLSVGQDSNAALNTEALSAFDPSFGTGPVLQGGYSDPFALEPSRRVNPQAPAAPGYSEPQRPPFPASAGAAACRLSPASRATHGTSEVFKCHSCRCQHFKLRRCQVLVRRRFDPMLRISWAWPRPAPFRARDSLPA
eukprot:s385_g14.t1